jgi:hypothetical protein
MDDPRPGRLLITRDRWAQFLAKEPATGGEIDGSSQTRVNQISCH